jgi:hypothetical protein
MGMFKHLEFDVIVESLDEVKSLSSYKMTEEAKVALNDLALLSLVILQSGDSMKSEPRSAVLQVLTRSLNCYGSSKYFTKLINEYDTEMSQAKNGFFIPYQQIQSPGTDLIFQLDRHTMPITHTAIGDENDSLVFTLSANKLHLLNMEVVKTMGEEELDIESEFFISVLDKLGAKSEPSMKSIAGFFVLGTRLELRVHTYDMIRIFCLKFTDKTLADVFLVGSSQVALFYNQEKYFDVYDVRKGELVVRTTFDSVIRQMYCSTHKSLVNIGEEFKVRQAYVVAVLETNEVEFYETRNDSTDSFLNKKFQLPASGHGVSSVSFMRKNQFDYLIDGFRIFYKNGSILYMNYDAESENFLFKPKAFSNIFYTFVDRAQYGDLFLGSNNRLYAMFEVHSQAKFVEIEGDFDNGRLLNEFSLVGIRRGVLHFFMYNSSEWKKSDKKKKVEIRFVKIAELSLHFEDIVFFFQKGKKQFVYFLCLCQSLQ